MADRDVRGLAASRRTERPSRRSSRRPTRGSTTRRPPRNMTTDWIGPRMYRPSLEEVLRGALAPAAPNVHYITGLSLSEATAALSSTCASGLQTRRSCSDTRSSRSTPRLGSCDSRTASSRRTTAWSPPSRSLTSSHCCPTSRRTSSDAAASLACSEVVLVNLGVARPDISKTHITYFYDEDIVFSRLSFPHLHLAEHCAARHREHPGRGVLLGKVPASGAARRTTTSSPSCTISSAAASSAKTTTSSHRSTRALSVRERHLRPRPRARTRPDPRLPRRARHRMVRPIWRLGPHLDRRGVHERGAGRGVGDARLGSAPPTHPRLAHDPALPEAAACVTIRCVRDRGGEWEGSNARELRRVRQ